MTAMWERAGNFLTSEAGIRLAAFLGVLVSMLVLELLVPRRPRTVAGPVRRLSNLGLVVVNTFAARLILPVTAVGVALISVREGWGLFNWLELPAWLEITLAVVALDAAIYGQHVLFHTVPIFWRMHLVHHADLDFDVTTGLRFHTLEILVSMLIKFALIVLLGPAAVAVIIFEVVLNATSMFNHANIQIPEPLDRMLRLLLVTPDMHRVHHSVIPRETNSNYGFNLPWWDYLFGTYRPQPAEGHLQMTIGLQQHRDAREADRLLPMLAMPFRSTSREVDSTDPAPKDSGRTPKDVTHV